MDAADAAREEAAGKEKNADIKRTCNTCAHRTYRLDACSTRCWTCSAQHALNRSRPLPLWEPRQLCPHCGA